MITEIGTDLEKAAALLRMGELVAIPTETVYGLAGNALNENAVLKIFKAKERPHFNPLIIHLTSWSFASVYASEIPAEIDLLAHHFMPGPITFLVTKRDLVPDLVTAGSAKVAIRVPGHPLTHQLLSMLDFPLAAPSANRFGYVSPVTAIHVKEGLDGRIPYVIDGGTCEVGLESTIVDYENDEVIIRRTGKISAGMIEAVLGKAVKLQTAAADHPVAPGMLKSHYTTITPLFQGNLADLSDRFRQQNRLLLGWGKEDEILESAREFSKSEGVSVVSLSATKDLDEVAKNLFASMRSADRSGVEVILVPLFPDHGIGMAINDRLQRAQHHHK
jgi:L-threonylcarbamoyladenylate synthase